jgi:hypothetical protein
MTNEWSTSLLDNFLRESQHPSNNEWYNVRESGSHVERVEARQGLTSLVVEYLCGDAAAFWSTLQFPLTVTIDNPKSLEF